MTHAYLNPTSTRGATLADATFMGVKLANGKVGLLVTIPKVSARPPMALAVKSCTSLLVAASNNTPHCLDSRVPGKKAKVLFRVKRTNNDSVARMLPVVCVFL